MRGTALYSTQTVAATGCSTTCSHTPPLTMPDGEYTWRVQAIVGSVWGPYSAYVDFYVVAAKSNNSFDSSAGLWSAVSGTWSVNGGDYEGLAPPNRAGTIKHADTYTSVTLKVTMHRTAGGSDYANFIYVRGTPTLDTDGFWKYGYYFAYTNDNYFIIGKDLNGTFTPLTGWISHNVNSSQPVTLQIDANGSALRFSINGTPVMWGLDGSLSVGQVGVGYFRDPISFSHLEVKSAEVDPIAQRLSFGAMLSVPNFNSIDVNEEIVSPFTSNPLPSGEPEPDTETDDESDGFFSPEKEPPPADGTPAPQIAVSGGQIANPFSRDWLRFLSRMAFYLRGIYPIVQ